MEIYLSIISLLKTLEYTQMYLYHSDFSLLFQNLSHLNLYLKGLLASSGAGKPPQNDLNETT